MNQDSRDIEVSNLMQIFDKFMSAWGAEYRRRTAMRSSWAKGAEATKYRSVLDLVRFLAENPEKLTYEQMTGMALTAQLKEYYAGGLTDSSVLRRPDYYTDLMAHSYDQEPEAVFKVHKYRSDNVHFDLTVSGYHYLKARLTYERGWNSLFYDVFLSAMDELSGKKTTFADGIKAFPNWLKSLGFNIDDGHDCVGNGYTYNYGNALINQAFTWETIYVDGVPEQFEDILGDGYITIIQVHTGVDARWGFSDPVVYSCGYAFPYDIGQASVACGNCQAWWDYGYRSSMGLDSNEYPSLQDFPVYTQEEIDEMRDEEGWEAPIVFAPMHPLPGFDSLIEKRPQTKGDIDPLQHPLIIGEDGTATCPICGAGELYATAPYAEG